MHRSNKELTNIESTRGINVAYIPTLAVAVLPYNTMIYNPKPVWSN